jgi:urease accessory protein
MPVSVATPASVPASLRSPGTIDLSLVRRGGDTVAHRTFQSGCMRVRIPRRDHAGEAPCAALINTAGGVAEGDAIRQSIRWGEGAVATVATQAAEKVYRAVSHGATIATTLDVEAGADAEWLPQETILFDNARLLRDTSIHLAETATLLAVEAIVLGRHAMGETVRRGHLRDRLRIWRGGRLVYADALVLDGDMARLMEGRAMGNGAGASAVIVHGSPHAAALLEPVRERLETARGQAAASAWNGLLAVRLLAPDGETLRHDMTAALAVLRDGRPLPRVWRC